MSRNIGDYVQKLKNNWNEISILSLELISGEDVPTMIKISRVLNSSMPVSPHEKMFQQIIFGLAKSDKSAFIDWMKISKSEHFAQLIDGMSIASCLDMEKLIYVSYNIQRMRYRVYPYKLPEERETSRNTVGRELFGTKTILPRPARSDTPRRAFERSLPTRYTDGLRTRTKPAEPKAKVEITPEAKLEAKAMNDILDDILEILPTNESPATVGENPVLEPDTPMPEPETPVPEPDTPMPERQLTTGS